MPLTGTGPALGDAIVTALESVDPSMTQAQIQQLKTSWEAISTVIVNWIVSNAQTVTPGVQTGSSTVNGTVD